MPKFLVLGDVHGRFEAIQNAFDQERPDAILHVGDLCRQQKGERRLDVGTYPERLPDVPFLWILGNHENLATYQRIGIPLGFFGARTLFGIHIVGVGGIAGTKREVHWAKNGALESLANVRRTDILLTHEACSPYIHTWRKNDIGRPELSAQCSRIRPRYHFSGHHHHASIERQHGVTHYRLPYAWKGYAVVDWPRAELKEFPDAPDPEANA